MGAAKSWILFGAVVFSMAPGCGGGASNTGSGGAGASGSGGAATSSMSSSSSGTGGASTSSTSSSSSGNGGGGSGGASSSSSGTGGAASCGDGVLQAPELCDTAIPAGQLGACPSSCDDGDSCTVDTMMGSGCQASCAHDPVPAQDGDGCCPAGAGTNTDNDCKPLYQDGTPKTICAGPNHMPTIAAGAGRFAIGCMRRGTQQETPTVKVLDGQGMELASHDLLTSNGLYYTDIQVSFHDNRFQALYQYDCSDTGSWSVGFGWGCIDFREYDVMGAYVTPSIVFGETGHNGHPVLDYTGSLFGVAWVSYDDIYYRAIDQNRQLVGADKLNNVFVVHDPASSDDRDSARTHVAWDGAGLGIFSIMGFKLYFTRVGPDGAVLTPLKLLSDAFSGTYSGQFAIAAKNGAYFVAFPRQDLTEIDFMKVSQAGAIIAQQPVVTGTDMRAPQMFERDGLFYVLTNDANKNAVVTVLDENAAVVQGKGGIIGTETMFRPAVAYDPTTGAVGVAYQYPDAVGEVRFQRFTVLP